ATTGSTIGTLTTPVNGSGGRVNGIELAGSLPFGMLADFLNGFGVQASYARTDSSVKIPTSGVVTDNITNPNIPLPGLSKNSSNIVVYFEHSGFSARVGQRYRSDFIGEVSSFTGDRQLTWVKGEKVVDAQVGYEFQDGYLKGLSLLFQAQNLGNEPFVRYRDVPANEMERVKFGKTYLFGLNYKL
ncbi:MAG: Vitamin transporter BtuB, partial [Pseudomonadota bacterium]